jgi:hypothetical protein
VDAASKNDLNPTLKCCRTALAINSLLRPHHQTPRRSTISFVRFLYIHWQRRGKRLTRRILEVPYKAGVGRLPPQTSILIAHSRKSHDPAPQRQNLEMTASPVLLHLPCARSASALAGAHSPPSRVCRPLPAVQHILEASSTWRGYRVTCVMLWFHVGARFSSTHEPSNYSCYCAVLDWPSFPKGAFRTFTHSTNIRSWGISDVHLKPLATSYPTLNSGGVLKNSKKFQHLGGS